MKISSEAVISSVYKDLFKEVAKFVSKYNKMATLESLSEVDEVTD